MRLSLTLFAASALLICANAQVPSYVPTDGLVGWWPFNGNAVDESGNGNDGAVNGATLTPDRVGNANTAYAFDGIDDKIEVPNSNSLNPANVTFNFWMYANSDDVCVLSKQNHNDATSHSYVITHQEIWTSNRGLRTSWGLDCNLTASIADWGPLGAVPNNDWVMLTISIDSSGLCKQYVNAALNHTFDEQDFSTCNDSNSPLFIGHHWATDPKWMNGILDDIGMWSRALDSTEIMDLYTANIVVAPCVSGTSVSYTGLGSSYDPSDAAVTLVGTPANGVFIGPGISGNTFDPASAGVGTHGITYAFVDDNGCVNTSSLCTSVEIGMGIGGGTNMTTGGVHVYPNPNRGQFTVEFDLQGLVSIQVVDARGRIAHNAVFQATGSITTRSINLSDLASGSYSLLVRNNGGTVTQTVVIQ